MTTELREHFRQLHQQGMFVLPNPWDVGSARILETQGFAALATTSSGHAASLGRGDQTVTLDELVDHVAAITATIGVPLNVDAEYCFAQEPSGIPETVDRLADAGAAGLSIEDFNPTTKAVVSHEIATERVGVAADAARKHGLVLTARAENHIYGAGDLDDTITRLKAYRDAGAEVVYAPLLVDLDDIGRVVKELGVPVNVLTFRGGPSTSQLASFGVHRVSIGGAFANAAYDGLRSAASQLYDAGTL